MKASGIKEAAAAIDSDTNSGTDPNLTALRSKNHLWKKSSSLTSFTTFSRVVPMKEPRSTC